MDNELPDYLKNPFPTELNKILANLNEWKTNTNRLHILLYNAIILLQEDYPVEEVQEMLGITEKEYYQVMNFENPLNKKEK